MMKIKNEKIAELTTQQIVLLIILVTSFVVIILLFFRLNLQEQTDAEICHNSVVLKGKSSFGSGNLDCKTSYVCISGGEDCTDINPTKTIPIILNPKITGEKTKEDLIKEQVVKTISDEMANCWWMFGEGKVDYANTGESALGENICAVCSIVKFDPSVKNSFEDISYKDLVEDGLTKPYKNGQTYLQYIYSVDTPEDLYNKFEVIKKDIDSGRKISLEESNMIRTGISKGALFGKTGFSSDEIIYPYFFETSSIPEPNCDKFITKA